MVIFSWALRLFSLLSLSQYVISCGRQLAETPQHWQTADAVVVSHPLAKDQWSLFRNHEQLPQTLRIVEHGAASVAVNFKYFNLLTGDKVIVRDPNHTTSITITTANTSMLTETTVLDKSPHSVLLRTHPFLVTGDTVVVEYFPSIPTLMLPIAAALRDNPVIILDSYASLSYSFRSGLINAGVDTESTVGAVDESKEAICYRNTQPQMYAKARAVARLMIRNEEEQRSDMSAQVASWVFCTGWLVGRGNYLITNHHCIKDAAVRTRQIGNTAHDRKISEAVRLGVLSSAANQFSQVNSPRPDRTHRVVEAVVGFMAETKCCREVGFMERVGIVEATRVSVVAENPELDYALVRVLTNDSKTDLSQRYGYLRLRATGPINKEHIYIPQHPRGEPKEIAAEKDGKPAVMEVLPVHSITSLAFVPRESYLRDMEPTVWYNADTKPGSSGSPVIGRNDNAVVALHRAGTSELAPSASTDLFNAGVRIDLIARDLQRRRVLPRDALAS
ncbi:unnamed protein product [Peronospora belbahrii]|uniref:Serine protease n=1 Tax=Peronospora belbahrii TaxID=622444 RepID=A0AAU9KZ40_9STRA|nr:unnamed protein product [Peronospora belbahrii]